MHNFKILLVDDNKLNIYSLKLLIEDNFDNLEIYEALSVKEAFEILDKENIHLILSDIQMPEVDGFNFLDILKSNHLLKEIPFIFITGIYNKSQHIERGYKLGAIDYLNKPIEENILVLKLKNYINLFKTLIKDKKEVTGYDLKIALEEDKKDEILEDIYK